MGSFWQRPNLAIVWFNVKDRCTFFVKGSIWPSFGVKPYVGDSCQQRPNLVTEWVAIISSWPPCLLLDIRSSTGLTASAMATTSAMRIITLESVQAAGSQLSIRYTYGKHRFSLSHWYDFDLESLDGIYGSDFMEKVYTHCAAFSIFHLCSLKPNLLDWGPYSRWHTAKFERVWNST